MNAVTAQGLSRRLEQGDARTQGTLGDMYVEGQGVPQNDTTAVEFYERAAAQGHAEAQYNLGCMYRGG